MTPTRKGTGGYSLGVDPKPGLFNLMVEDKPFKDVLQPVSAKRFSVPDNPSAGRLFVLPSDDKTTVIPLLEQNPFAFRTRLQEVGGFFRFRHH